MAIAYHRDQSGAPNVYTTGDAVAQFAALKGILLACLVSGYGTRPAAGWVLIAEGANYLVLRNGTHSGYVCLTLTGTVLRVYLAATFAGMSGNVMVGDGLKSGIASASTSPQTISVQWFAYSTLATSWSIVADERTFSLSLITGNNNAELISTTAYFGFTLYVGEDSNGNFISVGGSASTSTNAGSVYGYFSGKNGFTSLKNPATGLLVDVGSLAVVTPSLDTSSSAYNGIYPLPVADLAPIGWFGGGVYGGKLRGLAQVPALANTSFASYAAQSLGRVGAMTFRDGSTPLDLGDSHNYFARMANYSAPFFLLTDNPEFW